MKVAICIISVGSYNKFLTPLVRSINELMLTEHDKTIFLFSDVGIDGNNIKKIYTELLPPPLTTLLRFKNLVSIKNELKNFDLIYFIDVDCLIVDKLSNDIVPVNPGQMVATEHPWGKSDGESYETNISSLAYVDKRLHNDVPYYQGCFFGGFSEDFIEMSKKLDFNIRVDLQNRIIAKWYDESHMNKYFIENPPKRLHGGYAFPDPNRWPNQFSFKQKIIHYNFHDQ